MKRILSLLTVLLLFCGSAMADVDFADVEFKEKAANIMNRIVETKEAINTCVLATDDISKLNQYDLIDAHADVALSALSEAVYSLPLDSLPAGIEHVKEESTTLLEEDVFSMDWRYLEQYGIFASCKVSLYDSRMRVTTTAYTDKGEQIGIYSIEYAKRMDEQKLLVFIGNNIMYGTTTRCIIRVKGDDIVTIATEELGQIYDVALDIEGWMLGIEPVEWSKDILHSKAN